MHVERNVSMDIKPSVVLWKSFKPCGGRQLVVLEMKKKEVEEMKR